MRETCLAHDAFADESSGKRHGFALVFSKLSTISLDIAVLSKRTSLKGSLPASCKSRSLSRRTLISSLKSSCCSLFRTSFSAILTSYALMLKILNLASPPGVVTTTSCPFFLPMSALPRGDSLLIRFSSIFASETPTILYSSLSPNSRS